MFIIRLANNMFLTNLMKVEKESFFFLSQEKRDF